MAYLIKAGVGLALFVGGVVLFNVKLQEMLDIGTCASGNVPFEIRPEYQCPEGIGTDIALMMGSIFGGLIGAAIFAFRGDPPWGERKSVGLFGWGTLAWGLFFAATGAALFLGQPYGEITDPQTGETVGRPDSQLGSTITGVTFLVMGVPALLLGGWSVVKGLIGRDERPRASKPSSLSDAFTQMKQGIPTLGDIPASRSGRARGGRKGGGDAIGKIERLQKLRESGALTDAEFEREKAKILAQG
jgi:hypothetical protein